MEKIPRLRKYLGIIIEPIKLLAKGCKNLKKKKKKKNQAFLFESLLIQIKIPEGRARTRI